MRTQAHRRERFLPYDYARAGIDLRVVRCVLDDRDEVEPDRDLHVLALDVAWVTATLTLAVEVSEGTHNAVMGADTGLGAVEFLVVVRCLPTFYRSATRCSVAPAATEVEITLRRDDLAGVAQLEALLVRASDAPRSAGQPMVRGTRVADSRSWDLRIDRGREVHGEYLDVRYHPFSKEPTVPARDRANLYLLRVEQETPELWINSDHERIAAVLDSKGTVGRHARVREVAFDQIAQGVWTQLFLRAARDYVQNEETVYAWQDAVLDLILRDVFPEVRSTAERRDRLSEMWSDLPTVLARLDAGLQRRGELSAHLGKLVDEREEQS